MTNGETLSAEETERRREDALKRMLSTPHKPHAEAANASKKSDGKRPKKSRKSA